MDNILYFSDVCPDTPPFLLELERLEIPYQGVNITESMPNLKKFLKIRDNQSVFDTKKENNQVGVPVLVVNDSEYIFDWHQLAELFEVK